jgi:hypothetical protein
MRPVYEIAGYNHQYPTPTMHKNIKPTDIPIQKGFQEKEMKRDKEHPRR